MRTRAPHSLTSNGFTLLEALVALVVISIGLLGLLGLQTVSAINTRTSESRSLASVAADDIADRIRANPAGAAAGNYDAIAHPAASDADMPSPDCASEKCTPAEMATLDAWEWDRAIAGSTNSAGYLPDGQGYVDCTTAGASAADPCLGYTITIGWNEQQAPEGSARNSSSDGPGFANCNSTVHDDIGNQCFITVFRP